MLRARHCSTNYCSNIHSKYNTQSNGEVHTPYSMQGTTVVAMYVSSSGGCRSDLTKATRGTPRHPCCGATWPACDASRRNASTDEFYRDTSAARGGSCPTPNNSNVVSLFISKLGDLVVCRTERCPYFPRCTIARLPRKMLMRLINCWKMRGSAERQCFIQNTKPVICAIVYSSMCG